MKSLPELKLSHPAHHNENIRYCLANVPETLHNKLAHFNPHKYHIVYWLHFPHRHSTILLWKIEFVVWKRICCWKKYFNIPWSL